MLIAAKVLARERKMDEAIACTTEVRELASRHSALPGGYSGVASGVSQEAFKLEVREHLAYGGSQESALYCTSFVADSIDRRMEPGNSGVLHQN